MRASKHDYGDLKRQFFFSEHDTVLDFMRAIGKTKNTSLRQKMKGWAEQKQAWKMGMVNKALEKIQGQEASNKARALRNILTGMMRRLTDKEVRKLTMADFEKVWKIFRVENKLPTTITKSDVTVDTHEAEARAFDSLLDEVEDTSEEEVSDSSQGQGEGEDIGSGV